MSLFRDTHLWQLTTKLLEFYEKASWRVTVLLEEKLLIKKFDCWNESLTFIDSATLFTAQTAREQVQQWTLVRKSVFNFSQSWKLWNYLRPCQLSQENPGSSYLFQLLLALPEPWIEGSAHELLNLFLRHSLSAQCVEIWWPKTVTIVHSRSRLHLTPKWFPVGLNCYSWLRPLWVVWIKTIWESHVAVSKAITFPYCWGRWCFIEYFYPALSVAIHQCPNPFLIATNQNIAVNQLRSSSFLHQETISYHILNVLHYQLTYSAGTQKLKYGVIWKCGTHAIHFIAP